MRISISPKYTKDDFTFPLNINSKIMIFSDRVYGWQIDPAINMHTTEIPHRGFAQLSLVSSFFEMIGKYRYGYIGNEPKSGKYFKIGLRWTFPDIDENNNILLDLFYDSIRCGLYHLGIVKRNIFIYDGISNSFEYDENIELLTICPDRFVLDIRNRFQVYETELLDPSNIELRDNFEKCFDTYSK